MGAYLRFDFIKKHEDLIVGGLPSLKMFEAKLPIIEKNSFNDGNDSVSFKWGGYIFSEFEKNAGNGWEYYNYGSDCYFIELANILCGIDERSYDDRTIYLFELDVIKNGIENVIKYAKKGGFSDHESYQNDMELLTFFLEKIIQNEGEDIFISCSIG
jgi:hypothetical protein